MWFDKGTNEFLDRRLHHTHQDCDSLVVRRQIRQTFQFGRVIQIATYGNELLAGGTGVWTSSDGLTWTVAQGIRGSDPPLEEPESWSMSEITTGRDGIVAVGYTGRYSHDVEEEPQAVVWTAKPPD